MYYMYITSTPWSQQYFGAHHFLWPLRSPSLSLSAILFVQVFYLQRTQSRREWNLQFSSPMYDYFPTRRYKNTSKIIKYFFRQRSQTRREWKQRFHYSTVHIYYFSTQRCENTAENQGCQMVYFQTKNLNLGKYCRALDWKMLVHFMAIWNNLLPFG
jgi:hypothetical protein